MTRTKQTSRKYSRARRRTALEKELDWLHNQCAQNPGSSMTTDTKHNTLLPDQTVSTSLPSQQVLGVREVRVRYAPLLQSLCMLFSSQG